SGDVPKALAEYELERKPVVETLQAAAQESRVYFETLARYLNVDPVPFTFQLLTRSGRVTYDDLRLRDSGFGRLVDRWFESWEPKWAKHGSGRRIYQTVAPPPALTSLRLGEQLIPSRVALLPEIGGGPIPHDADRWNAHEGPLHNGGGLLITDIMAVSVEGRIHRRCLELRTAEQQDAWSRGLKGYHRYPTKVCAVLNHAGRRGAVHETYWGKAPDTPLREDTWPLLAPSRIPYTKRSQVPREMTREDMDRVQGEFVAAAKRADEA